jgi:hypothetical protein
LANPQPQINNVKVAPRPEPVGRPNVVEKGRALIADEDVVFKYRSDGRNWLSSGIAHIADVEAAWGKPDVFVSYRPGPIAKHTAASPAPARLQIFKANREAKLDALPDGGYIKFYFPRLGPDIILFVSFHHDDA